MLVRSALLDSSLVVTLRNRSTDALHDIVLDISLDDGATWHSWHVSDLYGREEREHGWKEGFTLPLNLTHIRVSIPGYLSHTVRVRSAASGWQTEEVTKR